MIFVFSAQSTAHLLELDDLQRFRCEIALARGDAEAAPTALDDIAPLVQDHAWISTKWLRKTGVGHNGAGWLRRFETMIDKARRMAESARTGCRSRPTSSGTTP